MRTLEKLDEIMQCGLQFRFFNKPVRDDLIWDIKCFWTHVDVKVSEGFDSCEDCINDCWEYVKNYKSEINTYMENFQKELEYLINRHSMENGSNTPDFILAEYLKDCLVTFNKTIGTREKWYGREGKPSMKIPIEDVNN